MVRSSAWRLALLLVLTLALPARADDKLEFRLTFPRSLRDKPFTGRVYVLLARSATTQLRSGPAWFNTEPFFARDVKDWKPGEKLVIGSDALAFPVALERIRPGTWTI